ncbi:MAG TPA: DNA repair protein RecO [Microscillaceae bacterium]|jgi:DNA repair protein RecO (recombination protein O)|nr:DNA repair protein RecO [Microscillaceae bacterium]
MLQQTSGIVIHSIKYSESSLILKIYTEAFGLQSYMINGVRSGNKKAKNKIALYQPLALLDLVVYHKPNKSQIFRIQEAKPLYPYQSIPFEMKKTGIAFFLTELLYKTLREESPQAPLFRFLKDSLVAFDEATVHYEYFHLFFLLKLPRFLGFGVENLQELIEELSPFRKLLCPEDILQELVQAFEVCIHAQWPAPLVLSVEARRTLLDYTLDLYALHIPNWSEVKSLQVLRAMMG